MKLLQLEGILDVTLKLLHEGCGNYNQMRWRNLPKVMAAIVLELNPSFLRPCSVLLESCHSVLSGFHYYF